MKNNLVDELFDKSKSYKMAILCTYSLTIEFLENYLLNLDGLINCENIIIFTDRATYENLFMEYGIMRSTGINKKYLVIPIDTNGVFHSKLYMLASDKNIRIAIGSANLTREGLATNLEMVSVFEITKTEKIYMNLIQESIEFIFELAMKSKSKICIDKVNDFVTYINKFFINNKGSGTVNRLLTMMN